MDKIAIKVTSPEQGRKVIEYLESLGGQNHWGFIGDNVGRYYLIGDSCLYNDIIRCRQSIPEDYTEAFLPEDWKPTESKLPEEWKPTESKLPETSNTFRAKTALMCLIFYDVEDEDRFSKAVMDADRLIQELNK